MRKIKPRRSIPTPVPAASRCVLAASLAGTLLVQLPATAASYSALCNDSPCTIQLDARSITGPGTTLSTSRIALWFTGGEDNYDEKTGAAGAVGAGTVGAVAGGLLLGPVGLIGGLVGGGLAGSTLGRSADLFFTVVGYDDFGEKKSISFRFVNPKPAERMRTELKMLTGLEMGESRPIAELQRGMTYGAPPPAPGLGQPLPGAPEPLTSY
jgi:hypothetical protein